ncbi:MAG: hypothetical protein ACREVC_09405 [Burkholderiales bacterium]
MLKFVKSLLHGKSTQGAAPVPDVELMSFPDIRDYVHQLPELITAQQANALTKRLYEIALYDNHIEKEQRAAALRLLDTLKKSVESVMTPEYVEAYRQVNAQMEEGVRRFGIGSLTWLIQENQIPNDEIIPFIARSEHAELLEGFFAALDPNTADALRAQLAQYKRDQQP